MIAGGLLLLGWPSTEAYSCPQQAMLASASISKSNEPFAVQ